MKPPKVSRKASGTVPVFTATGPTLQERSVVHVPWHRSSVLHREGEGNFENPFGLSAQAEKVDIPPEVLEAWQKRLPKPVHRTAKERAETLATDLFKIGLRSQEVYGHPVWPSSIQDRLDRLGVGYATLYEQVEALTAQMMTQAENRQKEHDKSQVVREWSGRYN